MSYILKYTDIYNTNANCRSGSFDAILDKYKKNQKLQIVTKVTSKDSKDIFFH